MIGHETRIGHFPAEDVGDDDDDAFRRGGGRRVTNVSGEVVEGLDGAAERAGVDGAAKAVFARHCGVGSVALLAGKQAVEG